MTSHSICLHTCDTSEVWEQLLVTWQVVVRSLPTFRAEIRTENQSRWKSLVVFRNQNEILFSVLTRQLSVTLQDRAAVTPPTLPVWFFKVNLSSSFVFASAGSFYCFYMFKLRTFWMHESTCLLHVNKPWKHAHWDSFRPNCYDNTILIFNFKCVTFLWKSIRATCEFFLVLTFSQNSEKKVRILRKKVRNLRLTSEFWGKKIWIVRLKSELWD